MGRAQRKRSRISAWDHTYIALSLSLSLSLFLPLFLSLSFSVSVSPLSFTLSTHPSVLEEYGIERFVQPKFIPLAVEKLTTVLVQIIAVLEGGREKDRQTDRDRESNRERQKQRIQKVYISADFLNVGNQ